MAQQTKEPAWVDIPDPTQEKKWVDIPDPTQPAPITELQGVNFRNPPKPLKEHTWGDQAVAMGLRTVPTIGGGILGGLSSGPIGAGALAASGAILGEGWARDYLGEESNPAAELTEGAIAGVTAPFGPAYPGLKAGLGALLPYMGKNAVLGGVTETASSVPRHWAEQGGIFNEQGKLNLPSWEEAGRQGAYGTLFGAGTAGAFGAAPSVIRGVGRPVQSVGRYIKENTPVSGLSARGIAAAAGYRYGGGPASVFGAMYGRAPQFIENLESGVGGGIERFGRRMRDLGGVLSDQEIADFWGKSSDPILFGDNQVKINENPPDIFERSRTNQSEYDAEDVNKFWGENSPDQPPPGGSGKDGGGGSSDPILESPIQPETDVDALRRWYGGDKPGLIPPTGGSTVNEIPSDNLYDLFKLDPDAPTPGAPPPDVPPTAPVNPDRVDPGRPLTPFEIAMRNKKDQGIVTPEELSIEAPPNLPPVAKGQKISINPDGDIQWPGVPNANVIKQIEGQGYTFDPTTNVFRKKPDLWKGLMDDSTGSGDIELRFIEWAARKLGVDPNTLPQRQDLDWGALKREWDRFMGNRRPGEPTGAVAPFLSDDERAQRLGDLGNVPPSESPSPRPEFSERFLKAFPNLRGRIQSVNRGNDGSLEVILDDNSSMIVGREDITNAALPIGDFDPKPWASNVAQTPESQLPSFLKEDPQFAPSGEPLGDINQLRQQNVMNPARQMDPRMAARVEATGGPREFDFTKQPEVLPAESELDIFGIPKDRDMTPEEVANIKAWYEKQLMDSYGEDVVEGQRAVDEVTGTIDTMSEQTKKWTSEVKQAGDEGYIVLPPGYRGSRKGYYFIRKLSDGSDVVSTKPPAPKQLPEPELPPVPGSEDIPPSGYDESAPYDPFPQITRDDLSRMTLDAVAKVQKSRGMDVELIGAKTDSDIEGLISKAKDVTPEQPKQLSEVTNIGGPMTMADHAIEAAKELATRGDIEGAREQLETISRLLRDDGHEAWADSVLKTILPESSQSFPERNTKDITPKRLGDAEIQKYLDNEDSQIAEYLKNEDAKPPEATDIEAWKKLRDLGKRFLGDDKGEFDPNTLWWNLRRYFNRVPTEAELTRGMQIDPEFPKPGARLEEVKNEIANRPWTDVLYNEMSQGKSSAMDEILAKLREDAKKPLAPKPPNPLGEPITKLLEEGRFLAIKKLVKDTTDIKTLEAFSDTLDDLAIKALEQDFYTEYSRLSNFKEITDKWIEAILNSPHENLKKIGDDLFGSVSDVKSSNQAKPIEDAFGPKPNIEPPDKWDTPQSSNRSQPGDLIKDKNNRINRITPTSEQLKNMSIDQLRDYRQRIKDNPFPDRQDLDARWLKELDDEISNRDKFGPKAEIPPTDKWDIDTKNIYQDTPNDIDLLRQEIAEIERRIKNPELKKDGTRKYSDKIYEQDRKDLAEAKKELAERLERDDPDRRPSNLPAGHVDIEGTRFIDLNQNMKMSEPPPESPKKPPKKRTPSEQTKFARLSDDLWKVLIGGDKPKYWVESNLKAEELINKTTDREILESYAEALDEWAKEHTKDTDHRMAGWMMDLRKLVMKKLEE